ncbi:S49 family peptidase [Vibrio chaetopteri]|uniref:S49 family peptidase n=1 Tax=Vibrio chaetopteri TaxID=3016528 RepID=A0AAU8BU77_9VIBR
MKPIRRQHFLTKPLTYWSKRNAAPRRRKGDTLSGQIADMTERFKLFTRMNTLKVIAIVSAVVFGIAHTLYVYHFWQAPLPHIALIQLEGAVKRGSKTADGTILSEALKKAMNDPLAHAVIIEANSPGGSPVQAEILHRTMMDMRETTHKAIYFSVGEACASACLYMASAADVVLAHKNSLLGSVGVRMDTWGFDKVLSKLEIERRTMTAGANKASLDPFLPENPEVKAHMQTQVLTPLYRQFKAALIEGRGNKLDTGNPNLFTGLVWTGDEAVALGLADDIMTHFELREQLMDEYDITLIQNYTKPSFSIQNLMSSDFWAEVVTKALTNLEAEQPLTIR